MILRYICRRKIFWLDTWIFFWNVLCRCLSFESYVDTVTNDKTILYSLYSFCSMVTYKVLVIIVLMCVLNSVSSQDEDCTSPDITSRGDPCRCDSRCGFANQPKSGSKFDKWCWLADGGWDVCCDGECVNGRCSFGSGGDTDCVAWKLCIVDLNIGKMNVKLNSKLL